jgi:hypothetical protein
VALLRGHVALAQRLAVEAADLAEDLGNFRVLAHAVRLHGETSLRRDRPDDADAALDRALPVAREFGAPAEIGGVLCSQALLALEQLRLDEAGRLADEAAATSPLPHPMRLVLPVWVRGVAAARTGDVDAAEQAFRTSLSYRGQPAAPRHMASGLWGLASVSAAGAGPARRRPPTAGLSSSGDGWATASRSPSRSSSWPPWRPRSSLRRRPGSWERSRR